MWFGFGVRHREQALQSIASTPAWLSSLLVDRSTFVRGVWASPPMPLMFPVLPRSRPERRRHYPSPTSPVLPGMAFLTHSISKSSPLMGYGSWCPALPQSVLQRTFLWKERHASFLAFRRDRVRYNPKALAHLISRPPAPRRRSTGGILVGQHL